MDTSGQERYKSLNEHYYKKADACLLVYDISDKKTFEECKYYSQQIKERCKRDIKVILLGNKTDLKDNREVSSELGAKFATENEYTFMETSCLNNKNVADAFTTLIEDTNMDNRQRIQRTSSRVILTTKGHKSKDKVFWKKCCK